MKMMMAQAGTGKPLAPHSSSRSSGGGSINSDEYDRDGDEEASSGKRRGQKRRKKVDDDESVEWDDDEDRSAPVSRSKSSKAKASDEALRIAIQFSRPGHASKAQSKHSKSRSASKKSTNDENEEDDEGEGNNKAAAIYRTSGLDVSDILRAAQAAADAALAEAKRQGINDLEAKRDMGPIPSWMFAAKHRLQYSEAQMSSNSDLKKMKKKYRMALCIPCAKFFKDSPWAIMKQRKFEVEIFRNHEKSQQHLTAMSYFKNWGKRKSKNEEVAAGAEEGEEEGEQDDDTSELIKAAQLKTAEILAKPTIPKPATQQHQGVSFFEETVVGDTKSVADAVDEISSELYISSASHFSFSSVP